MCGFESRLPHWFVRFPKGKGTNQNACGVPIFRFLRKLWPFSFGQGMRASSRRGLRLSFGIGGLGLGAL